MRIGRKDLVMPECKLYRSFYKVRNRIFPASKSVISIFYFPIYIEKPESKMKVRSCRVPCISSLTDCCSFGNFLSIFHKNVRKMCINCFISSVIHHSANVDMPSIACGILFYSAYSIVRSKYIMLVTPEVYPIMPFPSELSIHLRILSELLCDNMFLEPKRIV